MIKYHNLNGEVVEVKEARIHVNDVGLLRGYGIFDFFPIINFQPLFEADYFNRFYRSAELMNLEVPVSREELHERVVDLSKRNEIPQGYTKLVLTGGYATDGYTPASSNLFILQHAEVSKDPLLYDQGVKLLLQKYLKDQPQIKTLHYANALKFRNLLAAEHALDLLYHDGRNIRETSRANFFIIDRQGRILTTQSNVLSGITKKHVMKVAASEGYEIIEGRLPITSILDAEEAFITSTTKGVLPVSQINDYKIGPGKAGIHCRALQESFLEYCRKMSV